MRTSRSAPPGRPARAGLLAGALGLILLWPCGASAQEERSVAQPPTSALPAEATSLPRAVGLPVYPGGREVASLTLDHPGLRERVAALTTRVGGGIVVSRLEAAIYRLPGAVRQDLVLAFYNGELGRERATKTGSRPPEGEEMVSPLPSGIGYLSITVDPDPLQPRDTRVVVVRVEGSPEARTLLKPLTEIVAAAQLAGSSATIASGAPLPTGPFAGRPDLTRGGTGAPISSMPRLPVFPNSQAEASTRLNNVQVQAIIRSLATGRQPPAVKQGIAGLLREARAVTLNLYRVPRPVAGSAIVEFYRAAMATYGGREVARDTTDPSRPLLVFTLPAGAGVVMIRAYPESTPLTAFTRAPLPSPISTAISVLRLEGTSLRP